MSGDQARAGRSVRCAGCGGGHVEPVAGVPRLAVEPAGTALAGTLLMGSVPLAVPTLTVLYGTGLAALLAAPIAVMVAVVLGRSALASARYDAVTRAGRPLARALRAAAWYCHRCELVFFPFGADGPIEQPGPVTADAFQELLWTAGRRTDRPRPRFRPHPQN